MQLVISRWKQINIREVKDSRQDIFKYHLVFRLLNLSPWNQPRWKNCLFNRERKMMQVFAAHNSIHHLQNNLDSCGKKVESDHCFTPTCTEVKGKIICLDTEWIGKKKRPLWSNSSYPASTKTNRFQLVTKKRDASSEKRRLHGVVTSKAICKGTPRKKTSTLLCFTPRSRSARDRVNGCSDNWV